jgi:hypothetical protein
MGIACLIISPSGLHKEAFLMMDRDELYQRPVHRAAIAYQKCALALFLNRF